MKSRSRPWIADTGRTWTPAVSVVIPVYNERAVLPLCQARTAEVLEQLGLTHELLFVDDGSQDGSGDYLAELARTSPVVKVVRLSRNFGKEAAMTAGIELATGDAVIVLDADLQDPPELIPNMINAWRDGADVVCMRRRVREGEGWAKRTSAHVFYRLLSRISRVPIPEDTGDFRLLSRCAVDAVKQLPERNRYMKGLFAWIGLPTRVLEYDRAPRAAGSTKWGYSGLLRLAFEGITSFSVAPLHWATALGLVAAGGGGLFGIWIVIKTLFLGNAVEGYPSLMAMITFLGGVQLLTIGLLGEYVGKVYLETKQRPLYVIRDVIDAQQTVVKPSISYETTSHVATS